MHRINPKDLPELKVVDLTVARAALIFISVTLFFVLPVMGITYMQNNPAPEQVQTVAQTAPQVAGVSTDASSSLFLGIDMNSPQGLLTIIGIILVGIAFVVVLYLIVGAVKKG